MPNTTYVQHVHSPAHELSTTIWSESNFRDEDYNTAQSTSRAQYYKWPHSPSSESNSTKWTQFHLASPILQHSYSPATVPLTPTRSQSSSPSYTVHRDSLALEHITTIMPQSRIQAAHYKTATVTSNRTQLYYTEAFRSKNDYAEQFSFNSVLGRNLFHINKFTLENIRLEYLYEGKCLQSKVNSQEWQSRTSFRAESVFHRKLILPNRLLLTNQKSMVL